MKLNTSKLVIFLGFPFIVLFFLGTIVLSKEFSGVCTKVLDGDTIVVRGQKVRLFGIDAPELDQKSLDQKEIGKWSANYLKRKIQGKMVTIKYSKRGYYGRIIGVVFYKDENINMNLIENGMALNSNYNKKQIYKNIEFQARLNRVGIFGTEGFHTPWYYRKIQ